ncbi:hypothetical protein HU675_0011480 [Bradyrhizobium septentrionale]|uniref:hypothetical protein n=1 Tax=Bradyrhizobium septentrionale TaxID=1404411 RepID=UPI0015971045|nr:hypothetical protein [Bradyrhizobium septentrionale]UGY27321.1 hypothetical protein HU675_0011480 [Bradyrhizobium septentrionale]
MTTLISKISDEWDKQKLRNFMENARRHSRSDIYEAAFRQLCRVEGRNIDDPLEAEFAAVMRALEEALTEEAGKTKRLNRTRQKLNRAGVRRTLADLAMKATPSLGFLKLVEFGMGDMSAESLILKYREQFEPVVVEAAANRLREYSLAVTDENMLPPTPKT